MIFSTAVVFLFLQISLGKSTFHNEERPNIVVFIADDLGWNDISIRGSNEIFTPNIDAIALNGILFDKHYSQQSCTPSRSAFLTGQYPIRLGYQGMPIKPGTMHSIPHDIWTLPKGLRTLGYSTHLVGKWHLGSGKRAWTPEGYGYDSHYGYYNGLTGYFDHKMKAFDRVGRDFVKDCVPITNATGQYVTDLFTKRAVEIIDKHSKDRPLYMVVSHLAVHTGNNTGREDFGLLEVANKTETDRKYSYIKDETRRMFTEIVERMDDSIGQVVKALSRKKMMNNTILVFFSDNGAPTNGLHENRGSNWPFRGIKLSLFEGGVRVPAMIYSPKLKTKGRIYKHLFHVSDWAPTLYAAAGGDTSKLPKTDGIDQWNSLVFNLVSKRKEILLNIDEELAYSGLISHNGRYKLLNNTLKMEYFNEFTGASGQDSPQPYDHQQVISSDTNKAIAKFFPTLQLKKLQQLRRHATIANCRKSVTAPPCKGVCLFDLRDDPCETKDLSWRLPNITKELWTRLRAFEEELVPQFANIFNPAADPKFCNGNWFNWMDKDGCYSEKF